MAPLRLPASVSDKASRFPTSNNFLASCAAQPWWKVFAGRGGYCLAKNTEDISVADIIIAVDEPLDATQCGGQENCRGKQRCMTHDLWTDLNRTLFAYLANINLASLVEKQHHHEQNSLLQDRRPTTRSAEHNRGLDAR